MQYESTFYRIERVGDSCRLVRVTRRWVNDGTNKAFMAARVTELPWSYWRVSHGPEGWVSDRRVDFRGRLLSFGNVREAGHGQPCLVLGDLSKLTMRQASQEMCV